MKKAVYWIFLSSMCGSILFGEASFEKLDLQTKLAEKIAFTQNEIINLPIIAAPTQVTSLDGEQISQEDIFGKSGCPIEENICDTQKPSVSQDLSNSSQSTSASILLKENDKAKKVRFVQEEFYIISQDEVRVIKENIKEKYNFFLKINSSKLQAFMNGTVYKSNQQIQTFSLDDSYTQITNIDGKIHEYKYAQKSIDRYSVIATQQKYPLKKISNNYYEIHLDKNPEFFDIKGCKIVIKKELVETLDQKKEVIIDLNTKRELRNKANFELFLECPK